MGKLSHAALSALLLIGYGAAGNAGIREYRQGAIRVQALSPTLVRLEMKGPKGFEDRPTFRAVERTWPGADLERVDGDEAVELRAGGWTVRVPRRAKGLKDLRILDRQGQVLYGGEGRLTSAKWLPAPGEHPRVWTIADTPRLVPPRWGAAPAPGPTEHPEASGWDLGNDAPDLYVFLPGGDYGQLRSDVLKLTGPTELPPLYLFGAFHSRFYPYTDRGALGIIREYRERGFPLDVFMVDTDWRVSASFGYDENLKLFPDMAGFLAKVHDLGLRVGFNDHPKPITDNALDPVELDFRSANLARWLKAGVDFWWFDRNWEVSLAEPLPGLRKEVWGMQVFRDITAQTVPGRRPLLMANVDGVDNGHRNRPGDIASHRFPFQWTGDTFLGWPYLRRGVENAVHAGVHSLVPYISEDLGTHQGIPSPEFYLRSYQYGVLSAVVRPHCSNSSFFRREPWSLGPQVEANARDLLLMRYRLLPHLYTAARANFDTGQPLLRRLDLEAPDHPEAARNDQYLLGDGLLVAPILEGETCNQPVPGSWLKTPDRTPGLRMERFANENLLGEPVAIGVEPVADRRWTDAEAPGEHFSTRWTGTVTPDRPVRLGMRMEEGGRLWVDGQPVVDQWVHSPWNLGLDEVTLTPGRSYDLKMETRHSGGEAQCQLFFLPMELPAKPVARSVWVPEGEWLNAWTGARVQGPRALEVPAEATVIPMFLRAGSLFPLAPAMRNTDEKPWDPVTLDLYPHPARPARAELYEDDRTSDAYRRGAFRRAPLEARMDEQRKQVVVRIGKASGTYQGAPAKRGWSLRLHLPPGMKAIRGVRVDGKAVTGWQVVPQGRAATPFQTEGPALDGPVLQVALPPGPVARAREVAIRYL